MLGFSVPDTLVTQDPDDLREFLRLAWRLSNYQADGAGTRRACAPDQDTVIFTNRVRQEHLDRCDDLRGCPTLFQEEIHKYSDVRITVVDGMIHAVELSAIDGDGMQRCDIRRDNMRDVTHESISLPDDIAARIRSLIGKLRASVRCHRHGHRRRREVGLLRGQPERPVGLDGPERGDRHRFLLRSVFL